MLLWRLLGSRNKGPGAKQARRFLADPGLTADDVVEAAGNNIHPAWAQALLEDGERELASGLVRKFVPALTLVAAHRLGCAERLLPAYARYLATRDTHPRHDWHAEVSSPKHARTLLQLSGRLAQSEQEFEHELDRILPHLGPPESGTVLDVGCGGGLWAIHLARRGYRVIGTDHHADLITAAHAKARSEGLENQVSFQVDDATHSTLPDGFVTRTLCIGVTPTLAQESAYVSLVAHLARVTQPPQSERDGRTVILGSNRWRPSRIDAVKGLLDEHEGDPEVAYLQLRVLENCFWLSPDHVSALATQFATVALIGETVHPTDGTRVDLLLR